MFIVACNDAKSNNTCAVDHYQNLSLAASGLV